MASFPAVVVSLLIKKFGFDNGTEPCPKARKLAFSLIELIEEAEAGTMDFTKDIFLGLDEEEHDPSWLMPEEDESEDLPIPGEDEYRFGQNIIDKETVREAINYYHNTKKGSRPLISMMSRFRWVKTKYHLNKLLEMDRNRETRQEKINKLKQDLREWVLEKMDAGVSLHDSDLRFQALKINRINYRLVGFKCCHKFIQRFKIDNRISSRKITRFVSRKSVVDKDKLDAAAKNFVEQVKEFVKRENIPPEAIFNCDQSGFVKEQHGARSLAHVGQKHVFRVVNSVSATTHSCTVLPQITASGTLRDKTFVVLQEPGGVFPQRDPFKATNLEIEAHTTHIMTKEMMTTWLRKCVFTADLPPVSLLILDSWGPFRDHQEIQKHVPPGKIVHVMNIPPGCTAKVQPLDVYFFFHVKKIMKKISAHVQIQGIQFPVHQRDNLLKCISQVIWIFSHQRFTDFLRYAWFASGYIDRPAPFTTPGQFIFTNDTDCEKPNCMNFAFLRCPYCEKSLCFSCFFVSYHRCK